MAEHYTRLGGTDATFASMIGRFGVVTVMNAEVHNFSDIITETFKAGDKSAYDIVKEVLAETGTETKVRTHKPLCVLDTLKVANVTQEGPTKTVTGGRYSNPLIKFGKSARLEMQDALGNAEAIEALCGGIVEYSDSALSASARVGLHISEDFSGPKLILGDSFFIDQKTGKQVKVKIVFYQFLPDSLFNLTQDAEGDATVFDMNGDLLTTEILVGTQDEEEVHGVFYSIVDPEECK